MVSTLGRARRLWCGMWIVVGVVTGLAGCQPRDPLDREVRGRTLAELNDWIETTAVDAGPPLDAEVRAAFQNLAARTPRHKRPTTERELHQRGNPLCRRVHGLTLREVLIESYTATNTALAQSNALDAENLRRLATVVSTEHVDAFERRLAVIEGMIREREDEIRRNADRIRELRGTGP